MTQCWISGTWWLWWLWWLGGCGGSTDDAVRSTPYSAESRRSRIKKQWIKVRVVFRPDDMIGLVTWRPACNSSPTLVDSNSISGWVRSWRWFNQPNVTTRCPPPWLLRRSWRLRLAKVPSITFRYGLHKNRSRTIHVLQSHKATPIYSTIESSREKQLLERVENQTNNSISRTAAFTNQTQYDSWNSGTRVTGK